MLRSRAIAYSTRDVGGLGPHTDRWRRRVKSIIAGALFAAACGLSVCRHVRHFTAHRRQL